AAAVAAAVAATGAQETSLADVLARAGQYVTGYERRFAVLVAEERYVQEIHKPVMAPIDRGNLSRNNPGGGSFGGGGGVSQRRTLVSDYLLVQLEMGAGWMPFRDVFSVDGKPVRDREDRLTDLFIKPHTDAAFDQAARIVADVGRGLEHAHQHGVLHRDLKPENVLLPANGMGPKVLDFGVAKITSAAAEDGATLTGHATIVGTPAYMAPEQLRGGAIDARVDVFSLGVMTFEALTGALPFGAGSLLDVGLQQASTGPAGGDTLPPGIAPVVLSAIALDPGARPPSPAAFADALTRALGAS
ncbi:MAG: serine/threonine-protein kinase, partial [Vicinamibacteria bacterium]